MLVSPQILHSSSKLIITKKLCVCVHDWSLQQPRVQLDNIHVEEVADGSFIPEVLSISNPCDYLAYLSWFKPMQKSSGHSAPLCYMSHLMATCANCVELASSAIFHNSIEFLRKVLSVLLTLYNAKYSQIQSGLESSTYLQSIQVVLRLVFLDLESWVIAVSMSSWCFEPLVLFPKYILFLKFTINFQHSLISSLRVI